MIWSIPYCDVRNCIVICIAIGVQQYGQNCIVIYCDIRNCIVICIAIRVQQYDQNCIVM